ncbi:MAG: BatA domain-containing protein, partial [Phycisphaeraceae bacterium]
MTTLAQLDAVLTHGGLAAAGTAAIAIPILIHLLTRLRRRPQAWGAMRFLIEAYRKHRSRLQLEQLLLLLVRCLVLIVFGLALASPVLSGCASTMFGSMGRSGRVVCLVIDDSLTTQARYGGATRFEALRETALALLDALEPDDRVSVWRAGRPARAMLDPAAGPQTRSITLGVPGIDHAAVRRAIEQMQPRYSRADLPAALALVSESLEQDDTAAQLPADQVVVVLLSDLAAGSLDLSEQPPAEVAALGERAKLLVARPMPGAGNVQVLSVRPGRHMVLVEPDAVTSVPIELRLRRFIDETPDRLTGVELSVLPDGAEQARQSPNASEGNGRAQPIFVRREHRWSVGQSIATINVDVPLTGLLPGVSGTSSARLTVTMRARIDPGTMSDALEADNQRWLILELRNRLRVGLVDGSSAPLADDPGAPGLAPHRWLTLALAPRSDPTGTAGVQGPIELVDLDASALDAQRVATLDAAMVLRPDMLDHAGWRMLADLVERGGLVWVFVPPNDVPAAWAATMSEQLGLDWQLGLEPVTRRQTPVGSDAGPGLPDAGRRLSATASAWSLALNEQVPEALRLLAADWDALLRPIQVTK